MGNPPSAAPPPSPLKQVIARLKPYLRWMILGGAIFFLAKAIKDHWQEVAAIRIGAMGWAYLAIALGITLLAHVWSGVVWGWILRELGQPVRPFWSISVYLTTNIAKYLPGNVWHFYGRVVAAKDQGISTSLASLSVLLEPLLMAASALIVTLLAGEQENLIWRAIALLAVLIGVHPRILSPLLKIVKKLKQKGKESTPTELPYQIPRYPLLSLAGEMGFLLLRGSGFLVIFWVLSSGNSFPVVQLLSAFSFAWLLGLVVPGAPGGIGVFEASMLALLEQQFPVGIVLGAVALYRLISTLAEALGAGFAYLFTPKALKAVEE